MVDKRELICIRCPVGCHITAELEDGRVKSISGNSCPRGAEYGRQEISDPRRSVTSTVLIEGAMYRRLPVRTDRTVPKADMDKVMDAIKQVRLSAPVKRGDVIIENVAGTGANLIATKDM